MELIIDFDKIKDPSKKEWLITSLKLMEIRFETTERNQTLTQYNEDLEKGNNEIEHGEFTEALALKDDVAKW